MSVPPALLVGLGTTLGTLLTAIYLNRRRISNLESWAWGRERDETDSGVAAKQRSLDEKIDCIEGKLDDELEARRRDHAEVEREVRTNRRYFHHSVENLAATLNDQLPEADVDVQDDVEPDWVPRDETSDGPSFWGRDEGSTDD